MENSKSSFIRKLIGFSMVTWISFVLGFIASPIATRLFSTEEYGKLNLFNTYANLLGSVCYLGLDQAYVRFFREKPERFDGKGLLTFCVALALGFSVLMTAILFAFRDAVSGAIVGVPDPAVFWCLCIYSFCMVMFRFLSLNYRMEQNTLMYTVQGVAHAILTRIAYLAVGFRAPYGRNAILSLTVCMAVFSTVFILIQRRRFTLCFATQCTKSGCASILKFAAPIMPLSLLAWVNTSITTPMLSRLLDASAVGIYSAALGLASSINIIQTGFNTYWAPYILEHYRDDESRRFFTVHRMMACLLTFFGLGITLLQEPVFLLLGKDYRSSVVFFPFLFLSPICYCLGETTGIGINIAKKTYWTTIIYLFSAVCNTLMCMLLIPILGMTGAAVSSAGSAILTLLLRTRVGEKYFRVLENSRYLLQTIGLMAAAAVGNCLLQGFAKYALLIGIFLLALLLFRSELQTLLRTLLQMLRDRFGKEKQHA